MLFLKKTALSALAATTLACSISFANHQDTYKWADGIAFTPVGSISNITTTGGIEAGTDLNNYSLTIVPKGYISTVTGTSWDGMSGDMSNYISTETGTVSFTYTSSEGKTCDITIESGSTMDQAELVESTCDAQLSDSQGGDPFWNSGLSGYMLVIPEYLAP